MIYHFSDFRYLPLVQLLLLFGCDPSAEDDCGHNALYYAVKRGSPKTVDEIIDALAKPLSLMRICRLITVSLHII
jgi:ankyrin repeat protein